MKLFFCTAGYLYSVNNVRRFTTVQRCCSAYQWSYSHGSCLEPLEGVTIGQKLASIVERKPDDVAAIFCRQGVQYTFQELLQKSDQFAAGLLDIGIRRGDRVGMWAPNCPEWVLAQYGTARAGIILVNINPAYQPQELGYALRKVGVRAIVSAEAFKTQNYYDMLCEVCPELPDSYPGEIKSKSLPHLKSIIMLSEKPFPGTLTFKDVMDAEKSHHLQEILDLQTRLQFDDPINIQFTSGTTGNPKGATLSHHNIINNALGVGRILDYHVKDARICMPVPLYHCFGMVLGSLMCAAYGSTVVYPAPSFEPDPTLQAADNHRCTSMYGTPTMFIDMLNSPNFNKYDLTSLHTGIMAGSPCPVEVMKQVLDLMHMPDVTIAYGTTETSPVTFQTCMDAPVEKRVSTIGEVLAHTEAKVVDEAGNVVPVGQTGELCIRGTCVMLNYWDDEEKTREVIGPDRWYKSGDIASMDSEGYVRIEGRVKDMIIRGGENIYPVEIENFLYKHPKVADVQIIGVPDKRLGEEVCAWIKLHEGETATVEEIKDFCKGQIAHFKIPHYILFVENFPLTITGKVKKFEMRQEANKLLGLEGESLHRTV